RKPCVEVVCLQNFMWQMVDVTGGFRADEHFAIRRGRIDRAGSDEQALLHLILQLSPKLIGPSKQRHVGRVFVVREADDPGQAVGGTHFVRDVIAFEAEDAQPTARKVVECSAPHPSYPEDDGIIMRHCGSPQQIALATSSLLTVQFASYTDPSLAGNR